MLLFLNGVRREDALRSKLIRNVSFVFVANVFALIVSSILSIVIPKVLSVESYGYWQLHAFYGGYVALLHFGWIDGIYIRFAGTKYECLDKAGLHSQFVLLSAFQFCISFAGVIVCNYCIADVEKLFAIATVFAASFMTIPRGMLLFLLQGGDRIKEYSIATIFDKIVYILLVGCLLICGVRNYRFIIVAAIVSTICSTLYVYVKCKDIIMYSGVKIRLAVREVFTNIQCGIKVSVAYLSGNLIVGAIKYLIEGEWGIETFGKASLTISMTNLIMVFINSVGIVLLPTVRNISDGAKKNTYVHLNRLVTLAICVCFIGYYPLAKILGGVLPQYTESVEYMALIFPICLFESKMGLLNNVYMKALRKENYLMKINVVSAFISVFFACFVIKVFHRFDWAVLLIVLMLMVRCTLADFFMAREMDGESKRDLLVGLICSITFIVINISLTNISYRILAYLAVIIIVLMTNHKKLHLSLVWIRKLSNNKEN